MEKTRNHIIFWMLFFVHQYINLVIVFQFNTFFHAFFQSLNRTILVCIIFYSINYIYLFYFKVETKYNFLLYLIIILSFSFIWFHYLRFVLKLVLDNYKVIDVKKDFFTWITFILTPIRLSIAFLLSKKYIENSFNKNQQQRKNDELHRSMLQAELSGLRNQINPHFLYNTLNFLYAQSLPFSKKISNSIVLLSSVMRYSIHDDKESRVFLDEEIEQIYNLFKLSKFQNITPIYIDFSIIGITNYRRIFPQLLVFLIEKCLSISILNNKTKPFIIDLNIQENDLILEIIFCSSQSYTVKDLRELLDKNIKQIILFYSEKNRIDINNENGLVKVSLSLTL